MSEIESSVFATFPEIETERLILREIMPDDAQAILDIFADPRVTQFYDLHTFTQIEQAVQLIDFFDESFELERALRWGIVRKCDNTLIGTCGYVWLRQYRGEIGYELASPFWRQGYMSEALHGIIEFGFEEFQFNRIEALVMVDNVASSKLLSSLGFTQEGLLRQHDFFKGSFHDMLLFSMLNTEYLEQS